MTEPLIIPWKRIAVEAAAIVVSILLAFAIDAWWDDRQGRRAESDQLLSIAAELKTNAERIQEKLSILAVADDAARKFISWMGPDPRPIEQSKLIETYQDMYSIGAFALLRGASETYLAGDRVDAVRHNDVRKAISDWYAAGDDLERQYEWLREAHAVLGNYFLDAIPRLHLDGSIPLMEDIQASKFPFNQSILLTDPRFESRMSLYIVRLRFVQSIAADLVEDQVRLLDLIQSAAEN